MNAKFGLYHCCISKHLPHLAPKEKGIIIHSFKSTDSDSRQIYKKTTMPKIATVNATSTLEAALLLEVAGAAADP